MRAGALGDQRRALELWGLGSYIVVSSPTRILRVELPSSGKE